MSNFIHSRSGILCSFSFCSSYSFLPFLCFYIDKQNQCTFYTDKQNQYCFTYRVSWRIFVLSKLRQDVALNIHSTKKLSNFLITTSRSVEHWPIFMGELEFATGTLSHRIYWFVWCIGIVNVSWFIFKFSCLVFPSFQVNPHTHQLKLCDFGSAKVLVSLSYRFIICLVRIFLSVYLNICFVMHKFLLFPSYITGQRRAKHIVHLLSLLSSTWAHFWCNRIHNCYWHLVSRLCSCWVTSWTGFESSRLLCLFIWYDLK